MPVKPTGIESMMANMPLSFSITTPTLCQRSLPARSTLVLISYLTAMLFSLCDLHFYKSTDLVGYFHRQTELLVVDLQRI